MILLMLTWIKNDFLNLRMWGENTMFSGSLPQSNLVPSFTVTEHKETNSTLR